MNEVIGAIILFVIAGLQGLAEYRSRQTRSRISTIEESQVDIQKDSAVLRSLDDVTAARDEYKVERDEYKRLVTQQGAELNQLKQTVAGMQAATQLAQTDQRKDKETITRLQEQLKDMDDLRRRIEELERRLDEVTKDREQLAHELASLKEAMRTKDTEHAVTVARLEAHLEEARAENARMHATLGKFSRADAIEAPAPEPQPGGGESSNATHAQE